MFKPYWPTLYHIWSVHVEKFLLWFNFLWITFLLFQVCWFPLLVILDSMTLVADTFSIFCRWAVLALTGEVVWIMRTLGMIRMSLGLCYYFSCGAHDMTDDFGIILLYLTVFHLFCKQNTLRQAGLINFVQDSASPGVLELSNN